MSQPNDPPLHVPDDMPPSCVDAILDWMGKSMSWMTGLTATDGEITIAYQQMQLEIIEYWNTRAAGTIYARIADHLLSIDDASTPAAGDLARGRALGLVEALTILGGQR